MEKMGFVNQRTFHMRLVEWVFDFLVRESRRNKKDIRYIIPSRPGYTRAKLKLTTGETIRPDIIDDTNKLAYEIHVKGERRREYFDSLPEGWKGINVFFDEEDNPETLIVKLKSGKIERIKWNKNF